MGEKGVGKLSQETPPPREGEPMGACCSVLRPLSHPSSLLGYKVYIILHRCVA